MAKAMKKKRSQDTKATPFTESGQRDDEVVLVFDDKQKLYVSRNFLCYASPVFETMFNIDFKEKEENTVKLVSKSYDDFLEFLLCLHPAVQKEINESNVLKIIPLAEEYQVLSSVSKCKKIMQDWLVRAAGAPTEYMEYQISPLRDCLRISETAKLLNYEDIVTFAVDSIAKFNYHLYDVEYPTSSNWFNYQIINEKLGDIREECFSLFGKLPAEFRCRILTKRLQRIEKTVPI